MRSVVAEMMTYLLEKRISVLENFEDFELCPLYMRPISYRISSGGMAVQSCRS